METDKTVRLFASSLVAMLRAFFVEANAHKNSNMNQNFDTIADIDRAINKQYKANSRLRGEIRVLQKELERRKWALIALQKRGSTNETLKSQHARAIGEELPGKIKSIEEAIKSNKETVKLLHMKKRNMPAPDGGASAAVYGASTRAPVSTPQMATIENYHRINVEAMRVADSEFPATVNELTAEVAQAKALIFLGEQQRLHQIERERAARERELEAQRREA